MLCPRVTSARPRFCPSSEANRRVALSAGWALACGLAWARPAGAQGALGVEPVGEAGVGRVPAVGVRVPRAVPAVKAVRPGLALPTAPGNYAGWQPGVNRAVTALAQSKDGALWVATEDIGVWRYDQGAAANATEVGANKGASPGGAWTQFTAKDGLADESAYALAVDKGGRVWAGTLNHGVSVWNGKAWRNYGVLDGPLGERVFDIAVCPTDGDVWIATNAGLTRYSVSKDSWSYITRAQGLPSDQVQAIAFDQAGNIILGTQCDGVALASAADGYKKWSVVSGPDQMPLTPTGTGLPSSLINDVLVARDGTIYTATTTGLAWSGDDGANWRYVRGQDYAAKVKGLAGGAPAGWQEAPQPGVLLAEDYVSCLAQDEAGRLWLGHWREGSEVLEMANGSSGGIKSVVAQENSGFVKAILPTESAPILLARYNEGLADSLLHQDVQSGAVSARAESLVARTQSDAKLPSPAKTPTLDEIDALMKPLSGLREPLAVGGAYYEADDWKTKGNWMGRYGRDYTVLCAAQSPLNHYATLDSNSYQVDGFIGPHIKNNDSLRHWVHWVETENPNSLYDPVAGYRRQAEWDDHGESYPVEWEGPDLWAKVVVPEGVHRLSLYFFNKDGHSGFNRARDYALEVHRGTGIEDPKAQILALDGAPPLAHGRVRDFWNGVFKRFIVRGPATYWVKVARNGSHNTILSAVMLDKITGPATWTQNQPLAYLGRYNYDAPTWKEMSDTGAEPEALMGRARIWEWKLDAALGRVGGVQVSSGWRVLALRALMDVPNAQMPPQLLERWRWKTQIWAPKDEEKWRAAMAEGRESWFQLNPHVRNVKW